MTSNKFICISLSVSIVCIKTIMSKTTGTFKYYVFFFNLFWGNKFNSWENDGNFIFISLIHTSTHIYQFLELNFILNEYNYKISNIFTESMLKKKKVLFQTQQSWSDNKLELLVLKICQWNIYHKFLKWSQFSQYHWGKKPKQ